MEEEVEISFFLKVVEVVYALLELHFLLFHVLPREVVEEDYVFQDDFEEVVMIFSQ